MAVFGKDEFDQLNISNYPKVTVMYWLEILAKMYLCSSNEYIFCFRKGQTERGKERGRRGEKGSVKMKWRNKNGRGKK